MPHNPPKHIVAVSAYVTNEAGETLIVKTHNRQDTFELPGGQVEEGETPASAVIREVYEETGITVKPVGITGVYTNTTKHILSLVFKAVLISGEIAIQAEEIKEAKFTKLSRTNISEHITRPHMASRALDAIEARGFLPYEAWEVEPYQRLDRLPLSH